MTAIPGLVPLPVPLFGKEVVLFGDSITNHGSVETGTTGFTKDPRGMMTWANILLRQRLGWKLGANFGIVGDTTTGMLARYASGPAVFPHDIMIFMGGTNDVTNGITPSTTWANIKAICQAELGNGKTVVIITILPRQDWTGGWTSAQQTTALNQIQQTNALIRQFCEVTPGMILVDPWRFFADPTQNNGLPLGNGTTIPYYTQEGLHPAPAGAFPIGYLIARALEGRVPLNEHVIGGPADLYSATDNPYGNLLTNGSMQTTGGTLGSSAVTGSVAGGWKVSYTGSASGSPVTCSIENPRSDGGTLALAGQSSLIIPGARQVIAVSEPSGGGGNDQIYFAQSVSANFAPGDILQAECEVDVSNIANMSGFGLLVNDLANGSAVAAAHWDLGQYATNRCFNTLPWNGVLRTFPFPVAASQSPGPHSLTVQVAAMLAASGVAASVTFKVGNFSLRHVASP